MPTVVFLAKDGAGTDLSAVKITMDGDVLAERIEGSAIAVDPGEHTFTFETAGQAPVTEKLLLVEGQKERRETVTFGGGATAAAPGATGTAGAQGSAPGSEAGSGMGTQKILAIVAGGGRRRSRARGGVRRHGHRKEERRAERVPGASCPDQASSDKWSDAGSTGNISTIGFIVGGVGLAGAAALWFTAPSTASGPSAQVGLGLGAVQVKGTW